MKLVNTISMLSCLSLVACGSSSKNKDEAAAPEPQSESAVPAAEPTAEAPKAEAPKAEPQTAAPTAEAPVAPVATTTNVTLPAAAVVRVPVDAEGKEDLTKAELRLQDQPQTVADAAIVDAFDNAATPESIAKEDELDKTSSTQSWFFGRYSYGYNNRFNSCYQPSYYSYGQSYSYNSYPQTYGYGGYNYYYYSRPQVYASYGYSSYGYNGGYNNYGY